MIFISVLTKHILNLYEDKPLSVTCSVELEVHDENLRSLKAIGLATIRATEDVIKCNLFKFEFDWNFADPKVLNFGNDELPPMVKCKLFNFPTQGLHEGISDELNVVIPRAKMDSKIIINFSDNTISNCTIIPMTFDEYEQSVAYINI